MREGDRDLAVLFIGGPSRGGSTLLDRALGQIDEIVAVGELRYIWERGFVQRRFCGCGRPFWNCEFWQAVIQDALGRPKPSDAEHYFRLWRSVDRPRYIPAMMQAGQDSHFSRRLREYQDLLLALLRSIHKLSGKRIVVDSSKEPASGFLLFTLPGVELHLVHLVRDSRGVAYSWMKRKLIRPDADPSLAESYMNRIGPFRSAWVWNYRNLAMELLGMRVMRRNRNGDHPGSYVLLRYEDFVRRPGPSILDALKGVNILQPDLSFVQGSAMRLGPTHTVSGNPMRFEHGQVKLRLDEAWMQKMRPAQKRLVTAITLPYLAKYAYLGRADTGKAGS